MHILIVNNTSIPVKQYGGTERVIWWLGKQLVHMGHKVSYLVGPGSYCDFATGVHVLNQDIPFNQQIPAGVDLVHLNCKVNETPKIPFIFTLHGNTNDQNPMDINTVFVSKNHAGEFDTKTCHQYVMENFTSTQMTVNYLKKYETVLSGQHLNDTAPILTTIQTEKFLPFLP